MADMAVCRESHVLVVADKAVVVAYAVKSPATGVVAEVDLGAEDGGAKARAKERYGDGKDTEREGATREGGEGGYGAAVGRRQ